MLILLIEEKGKEKRVGRGKEKVDEGIKRGREDRKMERRGRGMRTLKRKKRKRKEKT